MTSSALDADFVMSNFWQANKYGSCSVVAIIKTAIINYGAHDIFKRIDRVEGDYTIYTLRTNQKLLIGPRERKMAGRLALFRFTNEANTKQKNKLKQLRIIVTHCTLVILKYLLEYGYDIYTCYSLEEAWNDMCYEGILTNKIPPLLGLQRKNNKSVSLHKSRLDRFRSKEAVVIYSKTHAVAAVDGYFDAYGTQVSTAELFKFFEKKKKLKWYALK